MYTCIGLFVFITITAVSGIHVSDETPYNIYEMSSASDKSGIDMSVCDDCISEAVSAINVLLNLILDEGVIENCGDLCDALANKTGSQPAGFVCLVVCNALGIGELIRILEHSDIDPIWYCQIAKLCPINDNGDAKFLDFQMIPSTGRVGTEFIIDCSFQSKNGTGPGMLTITIVTPQNQTASNNFGLDAKKPGTYDLRIGVKTLSRTCNPFDDSCNAFPTGTYNVTAYLCNGECGSHHPHSSIYDFGRSSFTVTP
ncbi:unnamed protein product [Adineta steineri]|uniref:Countin-like protein n=2 Tax=Adineta steineri TaxID=433720 RepID=A0A814W3S1_9BILA|nr:unnamed protein product [Adineta steineri]